MSDKTVLDQERLYSLDAYRGLIMVSLAFGGFGLAETALRHLKVEPDSAFWSAVQYQFSHVEWVGCGYWDLIQPSFMFMVGVSMAYSYAKRKALGDSWGRMFGHALWRSVVLVLLGVFLSSGRGSETNWTFTNVLSQIGLGYVFLFLFWGKSTQTQAIAAGGILAGTWALYSFWPGGTWEINAGAGQAIDVWFLNLFPRAEAFTENPGGYHTINFLPSLATMIFGLMGGDLLRSVRGGLAKVKVLVIAGVAGLVVGQLLHFAGVCPLVKRIWTPSWAIFSTGWCCLILGALYFAIDVVKLRAWAWPLVVVGVNSTAMYLMGMLLKGWVGERLKRHFGPEVFEWLGPMQAPMVQATMTGLVFWLVCWWMYRRKVFLRI